MAEREYREMTLQDYDAVYALWAATPGMGLSEADSRQEVAVYLARNPGQSFVCVEKGGRVLGSILCGNDGRRAFLYHAAVRPECRRQGVAARLLHLAQEKQRALGIRKSHIMIFRDNAPGLSFWTAMGFLRRDDLYLMSRETEKQHETREGDL